MNSPLETMSALFGRQMTGGGRKRRSSAARKARKARKASKASKASKSSKGQKMFPKIPKKYRMGFFGGNQKYLMCTEVTAPGPVAAGPSGLPDQVLARPPPMLPAGGPGQTGGAQSRLAAFKKRLDALNVEKLQRIAARKGVKITKKKEGKTVYVKKATLVRKICECKFGRKLKKRSKRSKRSKKH